MMTDRPDEEPRQKASGRKRPKKATATYLERAALFYLDRYASSAENLRRVLMRKVTRSCQAHGTDPQAGFQIIEEIIGRLTQQGLLDDRAYASAKSRALWRRGLSRKGIGAQLSSKGIHRSIIDEALGALQEDQPNPDLAAAFTYARKRRIGPFRPDDLRAEWRERDLAALGRRGFDFGVAQAVVDASEITDRSESIF